MTYWAEYEVLPDGGYKLWNGYSHRMNLEGEWDEYADDRWRRKRSADQRGVGEKVICRRCQVEMVPKSTFLTIWGNFHTEILCCPKCGEVYLPEALVKGRMADVERELEDK